MLSYQGQQIDTENVEGRALAEEQKAHVSVGVDAVVDVFRLSMDTAFKGATERKVLLRMRTHKRIRSFIRFLGQGKSINQTQQLQRQHILLCFLAAVWTLSVHLSQPIRQRQLFVVVMNAQVCRNNVFNGLQLTHFAPSLCGSSNIDLLIINYLIKSPLRNVTSCSRIAFDICRHYFCR